MPIQQITEARNNVVSTIRQVATTQNADFNYLLNQAKVESGLNPVAKAATSSAAGLFQFTTGTWFDMIKRHGDKVGLAPEAEALRSNNASATERAQMLQLRNDPQTATALAAHFAADNAQALAAAGHSSIGPTELYLAHFLGSAGATTFLNGLRDTPTGSAARALPQAANANASIFYKDRMPQSYQEIYNRFAKKFNDASDVDKQVATSIKDVFAPVDVGRESRDTSLKRYAAAALSTHSAQAPTDIPVGSSTLAVTEEAMTQYLKNFSLADHASGMTQVSGPRARDASQGASNNGSSPPLDEQSVAPLASGARIILRAVDQQPSNDGSNATTR